MATSDSWPKLFTWVDYFLFALTLVVSSLVGIYHAWRGASGSTSDYLMGGRKMPIFPVAMSLAARYLLHNSIFFYCVVLYR
jgi:Na+/proline symporter